MYCRRCGNKLDDTDQYCQHCGTPTGYQEPPAPSGGETEIKEEVIFNPPYENPSHFTEEESHFDEEEPLPEQRESKEDLEDLKEFISETEIAAQRQVEESADKAETVRDSEFVWNLYEFPSKQGKKSEDIEFNWNLEEFGNQKPKELETPELKEFSVPEPKGVVVPESEFGGQEQKEIPGAVFEEELFREIREESSRIKEQNIDRFFTFSRKNEEFQKLLDKEYEKFKMRSGPVSAQEEEAPPVQETEPVEPAEAQVAAETAEPQIVQTTEPAGPQAAEITEPAEAQTTEITGPAEAQATEITEPQAAEAAEPQTQTTETAEPPTTESVGPQAAAETAEPRIAAGPLSEMALARAQYFGDDLIQDNESIRKKLEPTEEEEAAGAETPGIPEEPAEAEDMTAAPGIIREPAEQTGAEETETEADAGEEEFRLHQEVQDLPTENRQEQAIETESQTPDSEIELLTPDSEIELPAPDSEMERAAPVWGTRREEETRKRPSFARILLVIFAIILAAEIAILAIRFFAPESEASKAIASAQTRIFSSLSAWFDKAEGPGEDGDLPGDDETGTDPDGAGQKDGVEEDPDGGPKASAPDPNPAADKEALIASQLGNNKNIEQVKANDALRYQEGKNYGLADLNNSKPIANNIWLLPENGDPVYYDQAVVGAIIAFDSQWIDYVNGGSKDVLALLKKDSKAYRNAVSFSKAGKIKETFKLLEIGEIRQGEKGFYAWAHEELQITENGSTTTKKYNWVYCLEPAEGKMQIVNYLKF